MTMAICIKCGGKKLGALTPCSDCRFEPVECEDQAKSMLLSDHYLSSPELENASNKLKQGQSIGFDAASVQELAEALALFKPTYLLGVRTTSWMTLGVAIVIGVLFGSCLVGSFIWLGL